MSIVDRALGIGIIISGCIFIVWVFCTALEIGTKVSNIISRRNQSDDVVDAMFENEYAASRNERQRERRRDRGRPRP